MFRYFSYSCGAETVSRILFLAGLALGTFPAGIDKASDADKFAGLEFCYPLAGFNYTPNDFVPWHHGVDRAPPFVADLMDIGMAYATI
jgi:hypothetical protein